MEAREITRNIGGKPRTLHILDFLKMIRHIGPVHVTFGEPIKITDHLDKDRKQLAEYTRQKCLELVKILPINIVACAVLDAYENGVIKTDEIFSNIRSTIEKLKPLEDRFRGFGSGDDPADIMKKTAQYEKNFAKIAVEDLKLYRLYASYIRHYFENQDNPLDKLDKEEGHQ
jgi:hypothetical protein